MLFYFILYRPIITATANVKQGNTVKETLHFKNTKKQKYPMTCMLHLYVISHLLTFSAFCRMSIASGRLEIVHRRSRETSTGQATLRSKVKRRTRWTTSRAARCHWHAAWNRSNASTPRVFWSCLSHSTTDILLWLQGGRPVGGMGPSDSKVAGHKSGCVPYGCKWVAPNYIPDSSLIISVSTPRWQMGAGSTLHQKILSVPDPNRSW